MVVSCTMYDGGVLGLAGGMAGRVSGSAAVPNSLVAPLPALPLPAANKTSVPSPPMPASFIKTLDKTALVCSLPHRHRRTHIHTQASTQTHTHLEVDHHEEDGHCGQQLHDVGQALAVEGVLQGSKEAREGKMEGEATRQRGNEAMRPRDGPSAAILTLKLKLTAALAQRRRVDHRASHPGNPASCQPVSQPVDPAATCDSP
jgi:hypothetical protein